MFGLMDQFMTNRPMTYNQTHLNAASMVVGAGLIALDVILDDGGIQLDSAPGGSAGNVLLILASLGWSSAPVGKLGYDKAANAILQEFRALNFQLDFIAQDRSVSTPVIYQHQLRHNGKNTHKFSFACPCCGEKKSWKASKISLPSEVILESLRPNVIYMDRVTDTGIKLAEYYKNKGVLVVFEPSQIGSDSELFNRALAVSDVVKYADDRLNDLENFDLSKILVEICTMGSSGLRYRAPSLNNEWVKLDSFHAPFVLDTSGAGDWCTAGLLYYLFKDSQQVSISSLSYNELNKALRYGQALSALNCMTLGARGLTKLLTKERITSLAAQLQEAKTNNKPSHDLEGNLSDILRKGWSSLLAKQRSIKPSSQSYSICCDANI